MGSGVGPPCLRPTVRTAFIFVAVSWRAIVRDLRLFARWDRARFWHGALAGFQPVTEGGATMHFAFVAFLLSCFNAVVEQRRKKDVIFKLFTVYSVIRCNSVRLILEV